MNKIRFITSLLFTLLAASCTSEQPEHQELQEISTNLVSVKMDFKGELSVSQVPLKNTESGYSDLFGIQIYDNMNRPYAYIVGDDVSQLTFDLNKEQEYKIRATYLKNGKNALSYSPVIEEWSFPVISELRSGPVLNQVYYSSTDYLPFVSHVNVHSVTQDSYKYAEVDRYYGFISSLTTTTEDFQAISLDLNRMIFGMRLRFDLSNLGNKEDIDQIRFSLNGYGERIFSVPVSAGVATLEIPHLTIAVPEFENNPTALDYALDENYAENIAISIGTFTNGTLYYDGVITIQRNKMMIIDHVLEEQETVEGGF